MGKKLMPWKTKGMNQDLSVSAFNPEFAFENVNLRLATNENNTLMSWVNERGTQEAITLDENEEEIEIKGFPVGTAVINHKLILFTTERLEDVTSTLLDRIYVIEKLLEEDNELYYTVRLVYEGNLNLDTTHPLETHVSYETDNIQKVYWTDNKNQPRVANIASLIKEPVITPARHGVPRKRILRIQTMFDFVSVADLDSSISVEKRLTGGMFSPGSIQYCYTYFNKYGQQTNIINTSPLYYLTHEDRAADAEDKVSNSFKIIINNPDADFDMVRIYSIHRTSLDATPIVKALEDLAIPGEGAVLTYTDTGTGGNSVDPMEMLYIGGREITALTMESKDQTLFLGNLTLKNSDVSPIQKWFDEKRKAGALSPIFFHNEDNDPEAKALMLDDPDGTLYSNTFTLNKNHRQITTFKGGDYYRFGFQLQKYTGEWSEPIFIKDQQNLKYPRTSIFSQKVTLVYADTPIDLSPFREGPYSIPNFDLIYKRIRPVIVYPSINDRVTLCQGVLNPTVFNVEDRKEGIPFAQSSWFFRPYTANPEVPDIPLDHDTTSKPVPSGSSTYSFYVLMVRLRDDMTRDALKYGGIKYDRHGDEHRLPFIGAIKWKTVKEVTGDDEWEFNDMIFILSYDDLDTSVMAEIMYGIIGLSQSGLRACTCFNPNTGNFPKKFFINLQTLTPSAFSNMFILKENATVESDIFEFNLHRDAIVSNYEEEKDVWRGYYKATFVKSGLGDRIAFNHYDSIYTDVDKEAGDAVKQAEIQGSVKKYNTPYSTTPNEDTENTNTQFFVDQSIVTLNSPDLELDTEVQAYAPGGWKLRIIGMLPITSSASAHKIVTSSSMLMVGYEEENSEGKTEEGTGFGRGELEVNTYWLNRAIKSGKRLVSDYFWEDAWPYFSGGKLKSTWKNPARYLVYPWQASRSLTADTRSNSDASSVLKTKIESNIFYSFNSSYFESNNPICRGGEFEDSISEYDFGDVNAQVHLRENEFIENLRLPKQLDHLNFPINYYPNIDKSLVNDKEYRVYEQTYRSAKNVLGAVWMRYKSGTHAVMALPSYDPGQVSPINRQIWILPYGYHYDANGGNVGEYGGGSGEETFWNDHIYGFQQRGLEINSHITKDGVKHPYDFLWLGELYKEVVESNLFGGTGRQAVLANRWLPAGDAIMIPESGIVNLKWTEGDTFYQRYDCLKTYPYTTEDPNQLVEILSFMCETHVNLDGRYDRNRGLRNNIYVMPSNFNLMNPVYSQKDNFFNYRKAGDEQVSSYPNLLTFTKTKESGADIDAWTNITLASTLEMDGDKGQVTSLQRYNNELLAFQDSGLAQILYNESVQVESTQGVPIELANSGKVQGKRYYSDTIGCSNKWSIANTPSGIYFMDSNDKGIYMFAGGLNNLSVKLGFNTWCKKNIFAAKIWNPIDFDSFVSHYDRTNQEVLFINKDTCLAFSEKLASFTSFYSYNNAPYLKMLDDVGVWATPYNKEVPGSYEVLKRTKLWQHQSGEYCHFFGSYKPYSMTLVGNPEPQLSKTFTNLEFRATVDDEGTGDPYAPYTPFDTLEAWNEYQKGIAHLEYKRGSAMSIHHSADMTAHLARKFRIWRCDIPRDNASQVPHVMDRMRNPWIYLKLAKEAPQRISRRAEIHDLIMTYFD